MQAPFAPFELADNKAVLCGIELSRVSVVAFFAFSLRGAEYRLRENAGGWRWRSASGEKD